MLGWVAFAGPLRAFFILVPEDHHSYNRIVGIMEIQNSAVTSFSKLPQSASKSVHLISLGCARNKVDSEVMLGSLIADGWKITDEAEGADAVIVNTCGFIGEAKEESIQTILEVSEHKTKNKNQKLVVAGCLTQRYKSQLTKGLPEVDLFIGTDMFPSLPELLRQPDPREKMHAKRTNYLYDGELPRLNTLNPYSAYLKVAEGCQHNCAFCIIPAIRGPLRSRPLDKVKLEAQKLCQSGVLELNLIAQDLAAYGRDFKNDQVGLLNLLEELEDVQGLEWIRLLYFYPEHLSDGFLKFMSHSKKIVPYLDVPMQSGSTKLLKSMKRNVTRDQLIDQTKRLRDAVPSVAIRTSVMVGFPGETEQDFEDLLYFVETCRFDHLGCFTYSAEEGTVAFRYPDHVEQDVMVRRRDEVMELQKKISAEILQKKVGTVEDVLVLGQSEESPLLLEGRLRTQAPEVDGVVLINDGQPQVGKIQKVKITSAFEYDLVGAVVS